MRYEKDAVSNSMLTVLRRCPVEFRMRFIDKTWPDEEPSEALVVGSAVHCTTLEPDRFHERYAAEPKVDGRTKEGKAIKAEFARCLADKTVLSSRQCDIVFEAAVSLTKHKEAARILKEIDASDAIIEKPFHGRLEDVVIAGTPDLVLIDRKVIYDIKTTQDASLEGFSQSMAKFGYHRQVAMYQELLRRATGDEFRFIFIAVSTKFPHNVGVYEPAYAVARQGEQELRALLNEYKRRKESNDWLPSWSKGVVEIALPRWYRGQIFYEEME